MAAKLHINLSQGLIEVEGDEKFVSRVYEDFKDRISNGQVGRGNTIDQQGDDSVSNSKTGDNKEKPKKVSRGKTVSAKRGAEAAYRPRIDNSLPIEKLEAFYSQFEDPNQSENILVFCMYVEEVTKSDVITADQIYTCYSVLKITFPKDMRQALRNAKAKEKGFIDFSTTDDIVVTLIGRNHFNSKLKRRGSQ